MCAQGQNLFVVVFFLEGGAGLIWLGSTYPTPILHIPLVLTCPQQSNPTTTQIEILHQKNVWEKSCVVIEFVSSVFMPKQSGLVFIAIISCSDCRLRRNGPRGAIAFVVVVDRCYGRRRRSSSSVEDNQY